MTRGMFERSENRLDVEYLISERLSVRNQSDVRNLRVFEVRIR